MSNRTPSSRSSCCHPAGIGHGFTLVELLVVIGIIAVLMSILMPVLGRARESAQAVKCLSNVRQIGLAIIQYSGDNRGFIVPGETTKTGVGVVDNWATILVASKYLPSPNQIAEAPSPVNTSTGDSTFRCPSGADKRLGTAGFIDPVDSFDPQGSGFSRMLSLDMQPQLRIDTWYAINGWTATDATNGPNAFKRYPFTRVPGTSAGYVQKLHKFSEFRETSTLPLVFDGYYWLQQSLKFVNARHAGKKAANVVFADGHAETVHIDRMPSNPRDIYNPDFHFLLTRP